MIHLQRITRLEYFIPSRENTTMIQLYNLIIYVLNSTLRQLSIVLKNLTQWETKKELPIKTALFLKFVNVAPLQSINKTNIQNQFVYNSLITNAVRTQNKAINN